MQILLKLLTVILLILQSHQQSMTVANQLINQNTTYNISIPAASLGAGSYIVFELPTSSYPASVSLVGVTCFSPCSGAGTNTINFTSLTLTSGYVYIVIQNILNPPSVQSVYFNYTFYNSPSTITGGFTYANFQAGTLTSCSIVFSPNTVSTNGTMTFTVTPTNKVLAGGNIVIGFPSYWLYSVGTVNVIAAGPTCSAVSNLNTISCTMSGYTMNVTGGFSTNSTSTFSFSVQTVTSIPVSYASTQVSLQTTSSLNNLIDSGTCTISNPSPRSASVSTTNTPSVGNSFIFSATSVLTNKITQNDILSITFPSTLTIVATSPITLNLFGSSTNCAGGTYVFNTMTISSLGVSGQTYSYNLTDSNFNSVSICSQISLTISGFNLSIPSTLSRSIDFVFSRTSNYYRYSSGSCSVIASVNALNSATASLTSDTTTINSNVVFTLSFITTTYLNTNSIVSIGIPSGVTVQGAQSCSNGLLNSVPFTTSCSYSSNVLQLSGFPAANVGSNITFSFSGFKNPASIVPVTFTITTLYSDGGSVDSLSSLGYAATPDTITQFDVTSTSLINGQTANYTITYITKNILPINSSVLIGIPIGITFNISTPTCTFSIAGASQSMFSCASVTSGGSYYNNGVNYTLNNSVAIPAGTNLSFTIGLINNPVTTQPSNPFCIYSSNLGNLIQFTQANTVFRITMTTPNSFTFVSITSGSPINGATSDYTISLVPLSRQPAGSILSITIPAGITVPTSTSNFCYNGSTQLTCTYSSPILSITLSAQLPAGSSNSYVLRNLINPRTMTSTSTFAVVTNYLTYNVSSSTASGITNTQPNNINTLSMTVTNPSQSYMNSTQDIQFSITTTNYLTSTDYINLVFPTKYKYIGIAGSMVSCSPYSCTPDATNISILKVTSFFASPVVTFTFTVSNYLSPNSTTNQNFAVYTYQADGTQIDRINTASSSALTTFAITCTLPCRTCSTSNLTQCITCYAADIYGFPYHYNQTCYATCPNTTYVSGSECIICVSPCKTCTTVSACTSCVSNYFLFTSNSTCLTACPATYYGDPSSYQCASCTAPCFNCSLSATSCTSCQTFYVLQGDKCLLNCTNGFFNQSGICYQCDISCARCSGSSTNCTTCATGFSRSGTECVSACPVTQVSINGNCVNCSSSCYECSGTTTNCTSCVDGKYLYNGACVVTCPNNTVLVNGVCVQNDTTKSLSDNKIIPFPYLIGCSIICIICFFSKFASPLTSIPAMGLSLNSIIQLLSSITILILTAISSTALFASSSLKMIGVVLIFVGLAIDIIFNITTIVYFCKKIQTDIGYMRWKKRPSNTTISRLCIILSGLYYKFIYFQFCKAFGSSHLHGTLQNPVKFYPITIMTLIGVFGSLFVITGCGLIALDSSTTLLSALYIQAIDCLLVKIVGAILALTSLKKADDFFQDPIKANNLQDLNQQTLQGLNDNMNDSFMMQHSVSYVGGKPYYDNPDESPKKKGLLFNSRNKPINQQDEDDGADQGLNKKQTGQIDDQDYFKTNDKNMLNSRILNQSMGAGNRKVGHIGNPNSRRVRFDENGNEIVDNQNNGTESQQLLYEDDWDEGEHSKQRNVKGEKNYNRNDNIESNGNDLINDQKANQAQCRKNQNGNPSSNRNKNSNGLINNLQRSEADNEKFQTNNNQTDQGQRGQKSPHKITKSPGKSPKSPNKGNSPAKSQKNVMSPGQKNKHQKLKDNSEDQINQELNEGYDNQQFLSQDDQGLGNRLENGGKALNKQRLNNELLGEQNSKTLGEQINLSSIEKKRSSRTKGRQQKDKSQQRNKSKSKQKNKQTNQQKQHRQKQSNPNTPINHLKNSSQNGETGRGRKQQINKSSNQRNKSKSPNQKENLEKLPEIQSKQLDDNNDSIICFQKDSNQRQEEPDTAQPLKKVHYKDKSPEELKKQQQKNSLDNADNALLAEELNQLNNNSGLIDSSAYGTEMIEGLVRVMSSNNNNNQNNDNLNYYKKNNNQHNNDEPSELQSAHEGDIQFPEVSPSQFNIQNQRYYDFTETEHNPHGQSNREFNMESFRRNNHTQHLYPGSQSETSIINNPNFYENRTGTLLPEEKHNIPSGISKAYQSFDQPLASIHEKGKSIRVSSHSKPMNQSLSRHSRYQTVTPDDMHKRSKLKSLQKIYLQPLDTKSTQPLHRRSPKYNI